MSSVSPDLNLIKLRWAGNYLDGTPCAGSIDIEYLGPRMVDADPEFPISVYPTKISLQLEATEVTVKDKDGNDVTLTVGYAELEVPATNDADLTGSGGVYRLNERIAKGGGRSNVDFVVDADTPGGEMWLNLVEGGDVGNPEIPSPVYWKDLNALAAALDQHIQDPVKAHQHQIGDTLGLQSALDSKQPAGPYIVTADTRLSDARTPLPHSHTWESITGKPNTFPSTTHGHTISNITGLQDILDDLAAGGGGGGPAGPVAWDDVTDKPVSFPPAAHTHGISEVTGLQSQLDGKQAAGDYVTDAALSIELSSKADLSHMHSISSVTGLQSALDGKQPAGDYVEDDDSRLSDARTPTAHTHGWTSITDKPTTFAPSAHGHAIGDVTGLQSALDGKQAAGSYATTTALTSGLGGKQDAGDYIEEGDARLTDARTPTAHTHAWSDVTGKPSTFAPSAHSHAVGDVTGLQSALDGKQASGDYATNTALSSGLSGKADASHTHTIANVTGLQSALDAKAASSHTHAISNVTGLQSALDAKGTSNLTLGTTSSTAKAGDYTPSVADLPAGAVLYVTNVDGTQARGTARTDVRVFWIGGAVPPTNAILGDVWLEDV